MQTAVQEYGIPMITPPPISDLVTQGNIEQMARPEGDFNEPEPQGLALLARKIDDAHIKATKSHDTYTKHAKIVGDLLLQAKAELEHGDFMDWVSKSTDLNHRTARRYMALAAGKPKPKRTPVSVSPVVPAFLPKQDSAEELRQQMPGITDAGIVSIQARQAIQASKDYALKEIMVASQYVGFLVASWQGDLTPLRDAAREYPGFIEEATSAVNILGALIAGPETVTLAEAA